MASGVVDKGEIASLRSDAVLSPVEGLLLRK